MSYRDWTLFVENYGRSLACPTSVVTHVSSEPLIIDYRLIRAKRINGSAQQGAPTALFLTGWGSGYEWITEAGFLLYEQEAHNINILHISLPGTGNSSNPPPWYWQEREDFGPEAEVLHKVLQTLISMGGLAPDTKFLLVGHSMGAQILAELAKRYPAMVERLVFLAPSGIKPITSRFGQYSLMAKFPINGGLMRLQYKVRRLFGKESPIEYLQRFFRPPEDCFTPYRKPQRWSEFDRICKGGLLKNINELPENIPILAIWGSRDFVCPSRQSSLLKGSRVKKEVIKGAWHNLTLHIKSDEVAGTISCWLHSLIK